MPTTLGIRCRRQPLHSQIFCRILQSLIFKFKESFSCSVTELNSFFLLFVFLHSLFILFDPHCNNMNCLKLLTLPFHIPIKPRVIHGEVQGIRKVMTRYKCYSGIKSSLGVLFQLWKGFSSLNSGSLSAIFCALLQKNISRQRSTERSRK